MKRLIERVIYFMLIFLICVCGNGISYAYAQAETAQKFGKCGDEVQWSYDSRSGQLTITGIGEMYDYTTKNNYYTGIETDVPWEAHLSQIQKIVVEDGITGIGNCAFSDCSAAVEVDLPSTLLKIGQSAFARCTSLSEITFPDGLKEIGTGAFAGCSGLVRAVIPSGVTQLKDSVFSACSSLRSIRFSENLVSIGYAAFNSCTNLMDLSFPDSLKIIGRGSFFNCSSLSQIEIPNSVEEISSMAFHSCKSLYRATICNDTIQMGEDVFKNCSNSLTICGNSNSRAEAYALSNHFAFENLNPESAALYIENFTINQESGQNAGETVTLSVKVRGGSQPYDYRFYYVRNNGQEKTIQNYSRIPSATFQLPDAGNYLFGVQVKDRNQDTAERKIADYKVNDFAELEQSVEEAIIYVRQQMVERQPEITVNFVVQDNVDETCSAFMGHVLEQTGNAAEGDYLRDSISSYSIRTEKQRSETGIRVAMTIHTAYQTTKEQEDKLAVKIDQVLNEMNLSELSEYEKCKKIYDYIASHVSYDYGHLNDASYPLKYTAYAAMINGTSVCEGYALLFYRMAVQAGLSARLITGMAFNGEINDSHAWNIVQLGDLYYNIDVTFDAGELSSGYRYFLVGNTQFETDHKSDEKYKTFDFTERYPVSESNYVKQTDESTIVGQGLCGSRAEWSVEKCESSTGTASYILHISESGKMSNYDSAEAVPWKNWNHLIEKIIVEKDITRVGKNAFSGCTKVKELVLNPKMATYPAELFFKQGLSCKVYCYQNSTAESYLKYHHQPYEIIGGSDRQIEAVATGYQSTYDGKEHQINVEVSGLDGQMYEIYYSKFSDLYGKFGDAGSEELSFSYTKTPITVKDAGTTTIYYYICANGYQIKKGSADIVIEKADASLKFAADRIEKTRGDTDFRNRLEAITDGIVSYSSSDDKVATVDNNGNVSIKGGGTCTITASAAEGDNYKSARKSYELVVDGAELSIIRQQQDVRGVIGSRVVLQVQATGRGLTYQWRYSYDGEVSDKKYFYFPSSDKLSLMVTKDASQAVYWCHITDQFGNSVNTEPCHIQCDIKDGYLASGICGDQINWTLDTTGLMTVEGTGAIKLEDIPWEDYTSDVKSLVIKGNISEIGIRAFAEMEYLRSVEFPDSIVKIGEEAFYKTRLSYFELPDKVTEIGNCAFAYIAGYLLDEKEKITLPAGLTKIGTKAFYRSELPTVFVPTSVQNIGQDAFAYVDLIQCESGSYAEAYAKENKIKYEIIKDESGTENGTEPGQGTTPEGSGGEQEDQPGGGSSETGQGGQTTGGSSGNGQGGQTSGETSGTGQGGQSSGGTSGAGQGGQTSGETSGAGQGGQTSGETSGAGQGEQTSGGTSGTGQGGQSSGGTSGAGQGGQSSGGTSGAGQGGQTSGGTSGAGQGGQSSGGTSGAGQGGQSSGGTSGSGQGGQISGGVAGTGQSSQVAGGSSLEQGKNENASDSGNKNSNQTPDSVDKETAQLTITASSKKIAAGKKITLGIKEGITALENQDVVWKSSNTKYATVNAEGVVMIKKAGAGKTVTITAVSKDDNGVKTSVKIDIMKNAVTKVKVINPPESVQAGKSVTLKAVVYMNGKDANKTLKWTSSNTKYAVVDSKGKVVAKKAGKGKTVTITVRSVDGSNQKSKVKLKIE